MSTKLKVGDTIKILPLNKIIEKCLAKEIDFSTCGNNVEIFDGELDITKNNFGNSFKIQKIIDDGDYEIIIELKNGPDIFITSRCDELEFLTGKKYNVKPKFLKCLDILDEHLIDSYDNGEIRVGCEIINEKDCLKLFKFLGDHLGYDVEK